MSMTGMIRKVDELGRIVLPVELRNSLGIHTHDAVEIRMEDDDILLWKVHNCCTFCGAKENLHSYRTKQLCSNCLTQLHILHAEDED